MATSKATHRRMRICTVLVFGSNLCAGLHLILSANEIITQIIMKPTSDTPASTSGASTRRTTIRKNVTRGKAAVVMIPNSGEDADAEPSYDEDDVYSEDSGEIFRTQADLGLMLKKMEETPEPCWRTCQQRNNHIVYTFLDWKAGLVDRLFIIERLINLAGYLCATVHIPKPHLMLGEWHNLNKRMYSMMCRHHTNVL
jgi:hypothetical protein